ncbi:acyl-CoA thioesterase [Salinithrix halophila]|uniref:Acyl-CoA thioesterase n=1 Tax=Salinithrix halophila TaxID=1485204 RepID=A0ABV8JGE3_9BACL
MKHEFELTVRSTDVDMIGHVNHAKYLEYMEWARFEWMRGLGLTIEEMNRRRLMPVVVHVAVNYRKELRMDERVRVVSEPARLGNKSVVIAQRLYNSTAELVCEAEITSVVIDAVKRKAAPLPPEFQELFETVKLTNEGLST